MTSSYYRGAHAIVIVFDVSDYNSFEHVDKWLSDINKLAKENVIKLIVGNKSDLQERKVSFEEAKSLCKKYNIAYIETSAKDNVNTSTLFETAALEYLDVYGTPGTEGKNLNLKICTPTTSKPGRKADILPLRIAKCSAVIVISKKAICNVKRKEQKYEIT